MWKLHKYNNQLRSIINNSNTFFLQSCLDEAKQKIENEIKELKQKAEDVKETMSDLKSHLYGKFGSNINLEADEE